MGNRSVVEQLGLLEPFAEERPHQGCLIEGAKKGLFIGCGPKGGPL